MENLDNLDNLLLIEVISKNAFYFQIIPVLIGIMFYRKISDTYIYLAGAFLILFVGDNIQYYFYNLGNNTLWVSNLMIFMQIPLYYKAFTSLNIKNIGFRKAIKTLVLIVFIFGFYRTFLFGDILEYKNIVYATTCILYIVCGLIYLFDFALYSDLAIIKIPWELVFIVSMILYFSITVGVHFVDESGLHLDQPVWLIRNITLICYSCVCGFIIYRSTKQHHG